MIWAKWKFVNTICLGALNKVRAVGSPPAGCSLLGHIAVVSQCFIENEQQSNYWISSGRLLNY
jgi:hypothetical protein